MKIPVLRSVQPLAAACVGCALMMFAGAPAVGQQKAAPAQSPETRLLCGAADSSRPRILIGRFTRFGEIDTNLGRTIEVALAGSIAANLLARSDFAPTIAVWSRDTIAAQQQTQRELSNLVEDAFLGGTASDSRGDRRRLDLQSALLAQNCDYLLGGRIVKNDDLILITPYLFDASRGEVLAPFSLNPVEVRDLAKLTGRFSQNLAEFLLKRDEVKATLIEVGCLYAPEKSRKQVEALAAGLRRRLVQELGGLSFTVRPLSEPALCQTLSSMVSPGLAATAAGEIELKNNDIELRPVVKVFNPDSASRPVLAIFLSPTTRPSAAAPNLVDEYTKPVRSFLIAVSKNGLFPKLPDAGLPDTPDDLMKLWRTASDAQEFELVALAAYRLLSQTNDDPTANYVLGRVFLVKNQLNLALEHFNKSRQQQGALSPFLQGRLNENLGLTMIEFRKPNEAVNFFEAARTLYLSSGNVPDGVRTTRHLATVLFMTGKEEEAIRQLQSQKDLETDPNSLLLIGRFSALAEKYAQAEEWIKKALTVEPVNTQAKGLLAEVYSSLGRRELASGNISEGRSYLARSLQVQEDAGIRYLSGHAAYDAGDFAAAIADFETIVKAPRQTALRWLEGAWLTLLECYLLTGNDDALETGSAGALNAIGALGRPRVVISYLNLIAKVIRKPGASTPASLEEEINQLRVVAKAAIGQKIDWNNARIDGLLKATDLSPDERKTVTEAKEIAFTR